MRLFRCQFKIGASDGRALNPGGRRKSDDIHKADPSLAADAHAGALFITVYRCAMAGFSVGQTDCWDIGWRALDQAMPPGEAGALFGEFYAFVRALLAVA
jgi:hypothetical protein